MKQIYLKFSMLLLLVVMGLSSAKAQVTQTVSGKASWSGLKWSFSETIDGESISNPNTISVTVSGQSVSGGNKEERTITLSFDATTSGAKVMISNFKCQGSGKNVNVTQESDAPQTSDDSFTRTVTFSGKGYYSITSISFDYSYTPVTLKIGSSAPYGTFCAPYDVILPSGVDAYQVKSSSKGYVNLEKIVDAGNTLDAGTPVILKRTDGNATELTENYIGIATLGEDAHSDGKLVGMYNKTKSVPVDAYLLQNQTNADGIAFYVVETGNQPNTVPYRAYLTGVEAGSKLRIGDLTIASSVSSFEEDASVVGIYSMSGAKSSSMKKGMNMVKYSDGSVRKVFVK